MHNIYRFPEQSYGSKSKQNKSQLTLFFLQIANLTVNNIKQEKTFLKEMTATTVPVLLMARSTVVINTAKRALVSFHDSLTIVNSVIIQLLFFKLYFKIYVYVYFSTLELHCFIYYNRSDTKIFYIIFVLQYEHTICYFIHPSPFFFFRQTLKKTQLQHIIAEKATHLLKWVNDCR